MVINFDQNSIGKEVAVISLRLRQCCCSNNNNAVVVINVAVAGMNKFHLFLVLIALLQLVIASGRNGNPLNRDDKVIEDAATERKGKSETEH